jgi:hypothetical protein
LQGQSPEVQTLFSPKKKKKKGKKKVVWKVPEDGEGQWRLGV